MTAWAHIASDPKAALRRAGASIAIASVIVALTTYAVLVADGPGWIIYAIGAALIALATMQTILPGAGIRSPYQRTSRSALEAQRLALASLAARVETARAREREQTEQLFEPEPERRPSLESVLGRAEFAHLVDEVVKADLRRAEVTIEGKRDPLSTFLLLRAMYEDDAEERQARLRWTIEALEALGATERETPSE